MSEEWRLTEHVIATAARLGVAIRTIKKILADAKPYPSRLHPGQFRYVGDGIAVVVDGNSVITVYKDRVLTKLRPDQLAKGERINRKE